MWDYFLILIAVVLLAFGFILQKFYQRGSKSSTVGGVSFSIVSAFCSLVLLILLNGFSIAFSWYSVINAVLRAMCGLLYTILGFQIMKEGRVALYMLFLMSGGMLVPAVCGWLFLNEPVYPLHVVGVLTIAVAIFLSNSGAQRPSARVLLRCCAVFLLNGGVSVFSKLHQVNTTYATVGTTEYAMLGTLSSLLMSIALFAALQRKEKDHGGFGQYFRPRSLLLILLYSAIGTASSLLQLEGAKNLPASVLYPMITGGTIILSGLFALLFFREKLSRRAWCGIALCLVGTCLFL